MSQESLRVCLPNRAKQRFITTYRMTQSICWKGCCSSIPQKGFRLSSVLHTRTSIRYRMSQFTTTVNLTSSSNNLKIVLTKKSQRRCQNSTSRLHQPVSALDTKKVTNLYSNKTQPLLAFRRRMPVRISQVHSQRTICQLSKILCLLLQIKKHKS